MGRTAPLWVALIAVLTGVQSADARRRPEVVQAEVDRAPLVLRVRIVQVQRMPGVGAYGTCTARAEVLSIVRQPPAGRLEPGSTIIIAANCWNLRPGQQRPLGGSFIEASQFATGSTFAAALSQGGRMVPESYQPRPEERQPWQTILR